MTKTTQQTPFIPDTAPFTPEQRSWLNGFFAGLYSRSTQTAPELSVPKKKLTILFGSQTGSAEELAKQFGTQGNQKGLQTTVYDMQDYPVEKLTEEENLLIVTSTHGQGDMPDNAQSFWEFLNSDKALKLDHLNFSVLALGDTNYVDSFCAAGKNFDRRLEELSAKRITQRVDCDVDYEAPANQWIEEVLKFNSKPLATVKPNIQKELIPYSKKNPYPARLLKNQQLTLQGSEKETRHFEIELNGSGLSYEVGDTLAIFPENCPQLVDELLDTLKFNGREEVPINSHIGPIREGLLNYYDITSISKPFFEETTNHSHDSSLKNLLKTDQRAALKNFLNERDIIDMVRTLDNTQLNPKDFVSRLKKLQPRLYSIASSPKAHPGEVHLTIKIVRYQCLNRPRKGVCSTYLAERVPADKPIKLFIQKNKNFRLPSDPNCPIIMIGPGTGIAPFRAFLEERQATGAKGKNWLFFGEQQEKTDFLYQQELTNYLDKGLLHRMDTAFSRDQKNKIYVQHRMMEQSEELFRWLQKGASFYVCGDATRMAKDVDQTLHAIIEKAGNKSPDQAREYVKNLKRQKRYHRDIY